LSTVSGFYHDFAGGKEVGVRSIVRSQGRGKVEEKRASRPDLSRQSPGDSLLVHVITTFTISPLARNMFSAFKKSIVSRVATAVTPEYLLKSPSA
jgi:hypothetical protein